MGQLAVGIVQSVFKPGPAICGVVLELIEKPVGKNFPDPAHITVACKSIKVAMNSNQGKSDGAGRIKVLGGFQRLVKEIRAHCQLSGIVKKSHGFAKAPERSAMSILGPDLLHPLPRISHEIAKAPIIFIIGIQKTSEIMTAEKIMSQAVCWQMFLTHGGNQ